MERSNASKTHGSSQPSKNRRATIDPELYARLQAEAKAPYRALRRFIYVAFGASGLIGAFIFMAQFFAGHASQETFSNLALQIGVVALMLYLFRIDKANG